MNKSRKRIVFVTYAGVLPFYLSPMIGYYDVDEILVRFSEIKMISSLYAALIVCFLSGMQWQKIIEANIKGRLTIAVDKIAKIYNFCYFDFYIY